MVVWICFYYSYVFVCVNVPECAKSDENQRHFCPRGGQTVIVSSDVSYVFVTGNTFCFENFSSANILL